MLRVAVVVEMKDGKLYQVALTEQHESWVLSMLMQLHGGSVKLLKEPIEGIKLTDEN